MIKKSIKFFINSMGYDIVKKYDSGHENDAIDYNSLKNVNRRNANFEHFKKMLNYDRILINELYSSVIKKNLNSKEFSYLDVGCGTGVLVNLLRGEFQSSNIFGCDFSEEKIQTCIQYYKYENFFVHDISTPISKKYEYISCTEVLEHLENPALALINLINSTCRGGKLFITVPDGRKDSFVGHIHYWSPESFKLFVNREMVKIGRKYIANFLNVQNKNLVILKLDD